MFPGLLLAGCLLGFLGALAPQQLPVILYKVALVVLAGTAGYFLDRWIFPYARPHEVAGEWRDISCMIRRAIIVAAAMLAVGLGL